ncbi:hypothetical protein [Kitasatospora xanthocidica]|uniref:hypothetical protein n=1 Tax=Kitasatospora xanthocidica TaxID=83382 RepID=UPI0011C46309|nr:hypothetical protein [Kitasatospora xanthocidica]
MQTGNIPSGVPSPKETLGYEILEWAETFLVQPDGENAGQPWQFTDEQVRFILWFYAIDKRGRWLYRSSALRRAKGWGLTQDTAPRVTRDHRIHRSCPVLSL